MERYQYLKSNVSDITYLAELIPAASLCETKRRGLIRAFKEEKQRSLTYVALSALHKSNAH